MEVSVKELLTNWKKYLEKEVVVKGWIRNNRSQKEFGFINLNDGSYLDNIQIVYDSVLENFNEISKYRVGCALIVKGTVVKSLGNATVEIKAIDVKLEGDCPEDYPIQPKRHTKEFLREQAYLRPRTNLFSAVFRMRSILAYAIHKFFQEQDFIYVNSPLITANDGEGAGEMFQVTTLDLNKIAKAGKVDYTKDFFGKPVNLTVTGQLEAETFAQAFKKVYTFGPTFRAENSNTSRHASEFWMIEPEIAFADLKDDINLIEKMVKYVVKYALDHAEKEIEFFDKFVCPGKKEQLESLINSTMHECTHHEAITILKESGIKFENEPEYGEDLCTEHEKYLTDVHFKAPVFITNWPKEIKAFYMRLNDDNKTVAAVDLLVPGAGELVGGSQREERLEVLVERMKELNMKTEDYEWYINLRKYGGTTHSGFGMGFERLLLYVTGVENIRDVIPYPRTPKNCEF